ncbi:hypothetical protein [Bifidobacterium sp. ESL0732]|uniref:hypothetical protein n=1 Tax=Bifidobacterium sp. ESL0732 TaxID=2983222 RepID=UPI0023F85D89|nr:hypothetical protein [Bifidobacterium sp. ESL0732]WEV63822.1 hypothetical protein OZX70_07785 [Bifidobacterium sp. ESL0732]
MTRNYITRQEYDDWMHNCEALARALHYPMTPDMVNDSAGIVYGADQYEAFEKGLWSNDPYEVMVIFQSLNEAAVSGLPVKGAPYAEYSGLCDKIMIVHPGKFCPPHFHERKTECYEVMLGSMDLFYDPDPVKVGDEEVMSFHEMEKGDPWPENVALPKGREDTYKKLTSYKRLEVGDPKFVMQRKHLHTFRCPPDAKVPLCVREVSTYSHEPTEDQADYPVPMPSWKGLHDNTFLSPSANTGRLAQNIKE